MNSKETIRRDLICLLLVMATGVVRLIRHTFRNISSDSIIFVLLTVAIFIWIRQVRKRLIQPKQKKYVMCMAMLILFLMAIRTAKFIFFPNGNVFERYAWYLYYFPQTFIVLFILLAVLSIGKNMEVKINPAWKSLYFSAAFIVIGILTNDIHQQAFKFSEGIERWNLAPYSYGPVYYCSALWLAAVSILTVVVTFFRCMVLENRRKIWIPLVPLIMGNMYFLMNFINPDCIILTMYKTAEVICFVFMAFMELMILTGLFPSNDMYGELWRESSIKAGIMDSEGKIIYKTGMCRNVSKEQVINAGNGGLYLDNGNVVLNSCHVPGGMSYWTIDISKLNELRKKLEEMGDVIAEENAMLEAENAIKEKRIKLKQQNLIYTKIAAGVKPELEHIRKLLDEINENDSLFERNMKYACVLNAFVKRYSNLLLLSGEKKIISSDELKFAIAESLEYIKFFGIKVYGSYEGKINMSGESIQMVYRVFQKAVEKALPTADAIIVNVEHTDSSVLRIEINSPKNNMEPDYQSKGIKELKGKLDVKMEEQTEYITLILPGKVV